MLFWRLCLPCIAGARIGVYLLTFYVLRLTRGGPPDGARAFLTLWTRWDVVHYLEIAAHGYVRSGDEQFNIAFLPAYPAVVAVAARLVPIAPALVIAMIVSNVASLIGLWYLYRWTRDRYGTGAAWKATLFAGLFPTAYFYQAAYTEGLFFALTVASFYYAERERWSAASLLACVAGATRVSGALLPICLVILYLQKGRGRITWQAAWLALAPLGALAYLACNAIVWHDPLRFLVAQRDHWGHVGCAPWQGAVEVWRSLCDPERAAREHLGRDLMELVAAAIGVVAAIGAWRRLGAAYGLYVAGSVLLWTSNRWWLSGPRFCLVLFPMFALLGARRRAALGVDVFLWSLSLSALIGFAIVFTEGGWAF